ncbi:PspA/IM30 family protein [Chamaesiphon sp.]|uniref:PspA/IM30 family protein n=1 Tax=Chamaesiphon sp. TaxID=2814140 RepID=UPI0035935E26
MKGQNFVNWLMGDRAGKVVINVWDWLWGKTPPVALPPSQADTLAIAERALTQMSQSVASLSAAVAQQAASYQDLQAQYDTKIQEIRALEQAAEIAANKGRDRDARLRLAQVIQQETLLEQLHSQVDRAEAVLISAQNRLTQEQLEVARYRTEIQNTRDLSRVNLALQEIARANDEFDGGSAKSTLDNAQLQATEYEMQQKLVADISLNRSTLIDEDNDAQLQAKVNERLAKLKQHNSQLPPN